jgi:hypothetical protein
MKLSNYIFSKLVNEGIDTVFLVTGGGAMHLNDAIGRTTGLKFVCNQLSLFRSQDRHNHLMPAREFQKHSVLS